MMNSQVAGHRRLLAGCRNALLELHPGIEVHPWVQLQGQQACRLLQTGAAHYELWKRCQRTSKVHAKVLQNLIVQRTLELSSSWPAFPPVTNSLVFRLPYRGSKAIACRRRMASPMKMLVTCSEW